MSPTLPWWRSMVPTPRSTSCMEVARKLQSYLDGNLDHRTAQRIERHLELCRRCGMEAETYASIKAALAARGDRQIDPASIARLQAFGERLLSQDDAGQIDLNRHHEEL